MARRRNNGEPKYRVRKTVASNMREMELDWELVKRRGSVGREYASPIAFFHDKDYATFAAKCLNGYVAQNPKRRKNIMSSAAGSYDDYGSYRSQRSSKRDRNPYSKRYTLASFSKKYWGEWYDDVDRTIRLAFWDDFKYGYTGGLGRYKEETRG